MLIGLGFLLSAAPALAEGEDTKVLLLLDVSGSMNEKISSGGTKLAAAKRALKQVADALPAGTHVGLRVYGSKISEPKAKNPQACKDSELVMPVGPLDTKTMYDAVDSFKAVGETPIAHSLGKAVEDLGTDGKRVLVLISDGEENCVPDPCPIAKKLADAGVDLQFNAIGLDVGNKARKQLQCIAEAGDGSYYDVDKADELSESIRKITQRALRPFAVSGQPITGGKSEKSATATAPGQYVDSFAGARESKFYRIERRPGSTARASVTTSVTAYHEMNHDSWRLTWTTESGKYCDEETSFTISYIGTAVTFLSAKAGPQSSADKDSPCAKEPLTLEIARSTSNKPVGKIQAEIVISEEPSILNQSSLPDAIKKYDDEGPPVRVSDDVQPVVGGTSFSNAAPLSAGTWSDTAGVGETLFYRVPVQTGQQLRATVEFPTPGADWADSDVIAVGNSVRLVSPSRTILASANGVVMSSGTNTMTLAAPPVRVRNREVSHDVIQAASSGGDHYIVVSLNGKVGYGNLMPIRIRVGVVGKPTGQPTYQADPTPTPSPSATTSTEPGKAAESAETPGEASNSAPIPTWALVAGGALLATASAGVGIVVGHRRR